MAWISFFAIVLGSFSLVVVLSVMSGLNLATENRLLKSEPHLVLRGQVESEKTELKLKELGATSTYFFETQDILFKTEDGIFGGAEAYGVQPDLLSQKSSFLDDDEITVLNLDGGSSTSLFVEDTPEVNFGENKFLPILIGVNI